ncbi:hypothetical protein COLO4_03593 [Corchorus olitorius]|uniref:Uncharacterized protein n=1 Tax=Corchorus olitorius TaxID=93759 RepID=A0A1R3KXV6_9ROSI|nr:hypothetical protein COLO4_03593 [Corchorus olitorius]
MVLSLRDGLGQFCTSSRDRLRTGRSALTTIIRANSVSDSLRPAVERTVHHNSSSR